MILGCTRVSPADQQQASVRKGMAQQDTLLRCSVGTDLPAQARKIRQGPSLT